MTDKNQPAFPVVLNNEVYLKGMDLRDWFAGMALQGIVASFAHPQARYVCVNDDNMKLTVGDAYKIADAMLEARNAKS